MSILGKGLIKIELGGGLRPLPDHVNVDMVQPCDVVCDFERLDGQENRLPFDNDSVEAVYSAHCLEHVCPYNGLLIELARVCVVGARVEIVVPHWNHPMAHIAGHKHAISEKQVSHWREFPDAWWPSCTKWFSGPTVVYTPCEPEYGEALRLYMNHTPEQIFKFVTGTCHQIAFHFTVEERS